MPWRQPSLAGTNLAAHLGRAREVVGGELEHFVVRRVQSENVAEAVLREAIRDYDLLLIGAAPGRPLEDPLALRIVGESPVPVVIVSRRRDDEQGSAPEGPVARFERLLVPVDGSLYSRYAAELAFAYAGAAGADVTILHVIDERRMASGSIPVPERRDPHEVRRGQIEELEVQIRQELGALAVARDVGFSVRVLASGAPGEIIVGASRSGYHDLLVLGAENKLLGRPLFFAQGTADIIERAGCTTVVVSPGAG